MTSFFGGSSSSSPSSSTPSSEERKKQIMQQVRQELSLANLQELVQKMGDNCYSKCITSPGTSLSSSDETCLAKCMDRYMDAFNAVARAYETRIRSEMSKDDAN